MSILSLAEPQMRWPVPNWGRPLGVATAPLGKWPGKWWSGSM